MDNILNSAKALNKYILTLDVVKEYQKYERLVKNHQEIIDLEIRMKQLQKEIVNKKAKQDDTVDKSIDEYQKIKEKFETHPLVVNYLYLKNEVDVLLQEVNNQINGQLLNNNLTKR